MADSPHMHAAMNPPSPTPSSSSVSRNHDDDYDNSSSSGGGGSGRVAERRRPWAGIATPLLDMLLPRLCLLSRVRLSSVCRSWHDSLADHPSFRRPQFPWLLIQDHHRSKHDLFFLCDGGEECTIKLAPAHAEDGMHAIASHGSWLIFSHVYTPQKYPVLLLNPISKARIELPICPAFYRLAVLSATPSEPDCTVICLAYATAPPDHWDIYYCPIRERTWKLRRKNFTLISNMIVMAGKLYFLCEEGLVEMDFCPSHPLKWWKLNFEDHVHEDFRSKFLEVSKHWLVESNGELLVVTLLTSLDGLCDGLMVLSEAYAYVHRVDFVNKNWVRVENLQGQSLFLSSSCCISLPAAEGDGGGRIYLSTLRREREAILLKTPQPWCLFRYLVDFGENSWFMPSL